MATQEHIRRGPQATTPSGTSRREAKFLLKSDKLLEDFMRCDDDDDEYDGVRLGFVPDKSLALRSVGIKTIVIRMDLNKPSRFPKNFADIIISIIINIINS